MIPAAAEDTVVTMLPFISALAWKHARDVPLHIMEHRELVHVGVETLLRLLPAFDASRGADLKSFVYMRMRGSMVDALRASSFGSRPAHEKKRAIAEATRQAAQCCGARPADADIAAVLGIAPETLMRWRVKAQQSALLCLDEPLAPDSEVTHRDVLPDTTRDVRAHAIASRTGEELTRALSALPGRERDVIALYYAQGLSIDAIARRWNVSASRVSQLHTSAKKRLAKNPRLQQLWAEAP